MFFDNVILRFMILQDLVVYERASDPIARR